MGGTQAMTDAGPAGAASAGGAAGSQQLLTLFYVFTPSEDRRTWTFVGKHLARDRDHAARLQFGPAGEEAVEYVAVSENAWKPKRRPAKVKPSPELIPMPDASESEPERAPQEMLV